MPHVRKTIRRRTAKRPFKLWKKTKAFGRKRFSKKSFYKVNNLNRVSIRPMVYPRELYVKFRSVQLENLGIGVSNSTRRFYLGNSATFLPAQGALGAFVDPPPAIPAGELYPGGFPEYGSFYDKHRVIGSSIKIEGYVTTNATVSFVRLVFIPITAAPDNANDTIANMINQLDTYTFDQLMAIPQAQQRQCGIQTGGFARYVFKAFRKTKDMLTIRDVRDNEDLNCDMPEPIAAATGSRPPTQFLWGYYFRAFNDSATQGQEIRHTVTVKTYMNLNQRRVVQALTST